MALLSSALASLWSTPAPAAESSRGAECAAIDDPGGRLACYDAAFPRPGRTGIADTVVPADAVRGGQAAPAPAPAATPVAAAPGAAVAAAAAGAGGTTATAAAAAPAATEDKFGLSERQRAEREPKPQKPPANALTAAVTAVRKLPSGYLLIDLDNDQQWQQIESMPNLYLRVGDRVTIRKAALGSFLLQTASNYSTRVRRIR